jgi:hypothetical protein
MKYISTIAVLFCFTTSALAQNIVDLTKPLKCSEIETVMEYFSNTHNEKPVWVGKTVHNTHITLLMNKENRSWTMVEYDSTLGCVLGAGDEKSGSDPSFDVKYNAQR